jgi:hypothetical protein
MKTKKTKEPCYYVTLYTSIMSPVEPDMAFNSLLIKIIEITDYFYYSKMIFTDTKGGFYLRRLLLPIGNIAGLVEADEKEFEKIEKALTGGSLPTQAVVENKDNIIKLNPKKD